MTKMEIIHKQFDVKCSNSNKQYNYNGILKLGFYGVNTCKKLISVKWY